jgi:alcohol dehydrogenase class IV
MDALSHCLEAYCATGFHPMADGIAMEGIRLVQAYLPRAVADGSDLEARSALMAASSMGATAFQKGLGAMHAMAHPLGAVLDAHHGLLNAIVMPYVLAFNRPAIEDRIERLAALMGLSGFPGFLGWVLALRDELGIPQTLQSVGMEFRHCAELAPAAAKDAAGSTNPVPLDAENLETLLAACMEGRLP